MRFNFRQLASLQAFPGTTVPVQPHHQASRRAARAIPPLSASSASVSRVSPLLLDDARLLYLLCVRVFFLSFHGGEPEERPRGEDTGRERKAMVWRRGGREEESSTGRHKEISREIHGRVLSRLAHRARGLTRRQRVPLSYQLIAGRFLSPWDVFSHGLQLSLYPRPPSRSPFLPSARTGGIAVAIVRVRDAVSCTRARLPIAIYEDRVTRP